MAWNPTTFRTVYAEFAGTPDAVVAAKLAEATARCDARVFGANNLDAAIGLLASHLLSIAPFGQQARREDAGKPTTYLVEWERLAKARASGPWAVGQVP